jgi:hypothetical protein
MRMTIVAVSLLCTGCGDDPQDQSIEVTIEPQGPCWVSKASLRSFAIRVVELAADGSLNPLTQHDECLNTANIPIDAAAIGDVFRARGYVVTGVSSTQTTSVTVVGHVKTSCGMPAICLMSNAIPPADQRGEPVKLTVACPVATPTAWDLCKKMMGVKGP